ncbi:MAG TPA: chemotaxis protein CheX [bacterium]|nr:chemotaxis protein CheX [bacterium]
MFDFRNVRYNLIVGACSFDEIADRLREVEADFVNPFLAALHQTLQSMGHTSARKGCLSLVKSDKINGDALVYLRVDGAIKGLVVLQLPEIVAKKLISIFLFGLPVFELDEMAKNCLREFSLRISELARGQLVKKGYLANVFSQISVQKPIEFSRDRQFLVVPLETDHGEFKVYFNVIKTDPSKIAQVN